MKAVVCNEYGTPEVLKLIDIEKPIPKANEILIKVHAASSNSWDWDLLRGTFINRLIFGAFRKPKLKILGADVAGTVEAVGDSVTKFKVGEEVFGDLCAENWGAFAEYVCASEKALIHKPSQLKFEEVAALPQAGVMALQSLIDKEPIKPGQTVLINGAGGGVGTYALQIAKSMEAVVTCVDKLEKLDFLKALGADHVMDYQLHDFTKKDHCYDLVIDVVGNHSLFQYKRILNPKGRLVLVGGTSFTLLQIGLLGPLFSIFGSKKLGLLVHEPNKNLTLLIEYLISGKIKSVIDHCYKLEQTADAIQRIGNGTAKGKVIVLV